MDSSIKNIRLNTVLKIIVVLFSNSFFTLQAQVTNDTSISKQLSLEQLVISAERSPVSFEQIKRSIQVINRKEIEQLPIRNVTELLGYALSTDVRNRGTFGIQADVSIRGGSFDQTLILLNGVNISDPQTGHHNMDIPVDISAVSRIEVLKGPGARIFGPNAFNGVINIITTGKTEDQASVMAMGGQHGLYSFSAMAGLNFKYFTHKLQVSTSGSDGYIENTDFKTLNLFYSGTAGKAQKMEYQTAYIGKAFGANSFYTPKYPDQYEETKTFFASLRYKTDVKGFAPVIYFRRHYDEFRLFRNEAPSWYKTHNYHYTDVMGSNANIRFNTGKIGSFSIGYDVRHELIRSNKLGDSLSESIPVKGENDKYYTLGKSRTSTSLFIEESIHVKRLSLSGGLLTSFLNALPEKIAFYPGLDISYNLNKGFRVYASANRTLRLPTFTDLYYNDNTSKGDPNLKPEEAICIETGVKYNIPGISAHAAVFKRYGHNMIDWVKLQSQDPWQAMNITDITVSGFETNVSINIAELSENTFFIQNISLGYTFLSADKSSDEYMSRYVLDILKHKADLLIYHRIWKGLSASWAFCFQDRNGGYIKYNNTVPETVETPYDPFFTIDLKINYQYKNWKLFAGATNLLNNEYVDFGNITQPGIWISAGVEFSVPYSFSKHK